jgi:hypothetical protein
MRSCLSLGGYDRDTTVTIAAAKRITIVRGLIIISGTIPRPEISLGFISEALLNITGCSILGNINRY